MRSAALRMRNLDRLQSKQTSHRDAALKARKPDSSLTDESPAVLAGQTEGQWAEAVELLGGHPQPPGRVPHGHTWDFVSGVWRNADGVERNADGVEP